MAAWAYRETQTRRVNDTYYYSYRLSYNGSNMEEMRRQQALGRVIIRSAQGIIDMPANDWTLGTLRVRQGVLDDYWSHFQRNHINLVSEDLDQDLAKERDEIHDQAEDSYVQAQSKLCDIEMRLEPQAPQEAAPTIQHGSAPGTSRLPRISIPEFSGRREDWEPFRDLFKALIHNDPALTDVERLYYLKAHVRGEARTALDSLQVIGTNYHTAWGLLEGRFEHDPRPSDGFEKPKAPSRGELLWLAKPFGHPGTPS